jgi:ABC-type branched-subunit amino acid transport system substrate-binding protein
MSKLNLGRSAVLRLVLAAAGGAVLSTAAFAFERPQDGVYADRIDWGVTGDMSGPAAGSQHPWVKGFQSYIKTVNDKGGVNGRKINVLAEDSRYDTTNERIIYEKFVSQTPTLGTSGMGNSSAQTALLPIIRRSKLPVVGTYTSAKIAIEPANPYFYGAFCGFKEMSQVGVGHFTDTLNLKNPKVATIHLDVASGKEFSGYMDEALAKRGGTNKSIPIKVVAADATSQVLEVLNTKPDFVAVHGVQTTAILVMKAMQQYGINVPTFGITYLGTPAVYESLGPQAGKNYSFVSCFTPASVDEKASAEMSAAAAKDGHGGLKDDINFVAGWVVGQLVSEAVQKVGKEPTREKLVEMLNAGFEIDSKGLSSRLRYTPTDHAGLTVLKAISYDYEAKRFKGAGEYKDYEKYVQ